MKSKFISTSVIVFDLGGVFVPDSTDVLNREMARHVGLTSDDLAGRWQAATTALFTGKLSVRAFYSALISGRGDDASLLEKHIDIYLKLYHLDSDMLKLLSELKSRNLTACMSNCELEIARVNWEKGLYSHFDHAFLSTEMGLRKPDREAFLEVAKRLDVHPSKILFVDDKEENVAAAGNIGMRAVHFTGFDALKSELCRLGAAG